MVAAAAALLSVAFLLGLFDGVDRSTFDIMSTIAPPRPTQPAAVIVGIDEASFSAVGKPWPWSRDLHASLIHALRQAGAQTIGFDVVFAEPTMQAADQALASAADSRTVLGADETISDTPQGGILTRTEPLAELTKRNARIGVTSVRVDPDVVVRHIPAYPDSFARRFVPTEIASDRRDRLIQYFGGPRTYPYVSYYQALHPTTYLPPQLLSGRDVMVGLVVQASPEVRQAPDSFATPFTSRDGQLVPGVEIQATIVDNLRHHLWITPSPRWTAVLLLIAGCAGGYLATRPQRLIFRLLATAGLFCASLIGLWLILRFGRIWASPAEPVSGVLATFTFLGIADFAVERRRRREIQAAFGQYVAPEIVRQIANDPDRVKLGGERKMITVLFADIRGFTTISEALCDEPEVLTRLINGVLSELSAIVTRHGGTIDKYIGDCLMAFWNAPLDDPEHAAHAISAALEMIGKMAEDRSNTKTESAQGHSISIGVGINSGECLVGNMGSHLRFDYTVLGDPVNVASRLEEMSGEYEVPLLIGEATVGLAGDSFDYLELGSVRVRGKQSAQMIYTIRHLKLNSAKAAQPTGGGDG